MLAKSQDKKINKRSARQYKIELEKMLFFLKLPVKDITTQHLRVFMYTTFKNSRTGEPLSPYTANQRRSIIRSFFSWCCANGFISSDPAAVITTERTDGVKPREAFTEEETEKLKYACANLRDRAFIELLLSTGVRATECVNIKRSDINMHDRSIRVLGKGNKYRTVFFNAPTKIALQNYWTSLGADTDYAFVSLRKPFKQIKKHTLELRVAAVGKQSGVDNAIPHRFRHTFATRLEERGCPIEVIQELLGHSNISTTTRYAHQSSARIKAEYNRYIV